MSEVVWMQRALDDLQATLVERNKGYKIDGEFSNFSFAADIAGIDTATVIMSQLAIKLGRIKGQMENGESTREGVLDSYRDLAGYSVILFAYMSKILDELVAEEGQ